MLASSPPAVPVAALRSEFLLRLAADLQNALNVGETPLGTRSIHYMKRGSFAGPHLTGKVLPGGGDWVLVRGDGIAQLDIRLTLRTDDHALIYVRSGGILDIAPQIRKRILDGEVVDSSEYYFRTTLAFETAAEKYRWINRIVAVGVGTRTSSGMVTDVFAVI